MITGVLNSCTTDVDLLEPADPIPVVYAVLCPDDSILQVRLTRTFDGSYTPEIDAKVSDSLYFADANVNLELRSDHGYVVERLKLVKTLIDDREPGVFATSPNYVYEGRNYQIRQGYRQGYSSVEMIYYLTINLPAYNQSIFAEAAVPPNPGISTNIYAGEEINIFNYFDHPKAIVSGSNDYFSTELVIEFYYENMIDGMWIPDSFVYKKHSKPFSGVSPADSLKFTPDWLYKLFAGRVTEDPNVSNRWFKSFEIRKMLISPEYAYYLSSLEFSPDYYTNTFSNIVNGKGIFAAYSKNEITGMTFSEQMLDSLALGQYTKDLRFLRWR